ncbi:MAG: right-handed parallel beta-helix repeat-containing protein, partial [Planctomycetota bacterium]
MFEKKNLDALPATAICLVLMTICAAARGNIIFVDGASPGANDGSSWADAYRCLQDALANAHPRDEIHVAKGIYKPDRRTEMMAGETQVIASGDRMATFQLVNDLRIRGGHAGYGEPDPDLRDIELYETILSGDLDANDVDVNSIEDLLNEPSRADNSYQVVTGSGTGETAVLDGFTITGGNANLYTNRDGAGLVNEYGSPQIIDCTFIANSARFHGGAIYNYHSSPTLLNCAFIGNSGRGGGVYSYQSHPILVNCAFTANSGEGMRNVRSNPILTDCTFTENVDIAMSCDDSDPNLIGCVFIRNSGGRHGGAMYCRSSNPILTECTFIENSADYSGGAVYFSGGNPVLNNCTFIDNSAAYGGAMHNAGGNPILNNCTLTGNSARDYGGAIYNTGDLVTLNNCILNENSAYNYGGAAYCSDCDMTLTNCTLVGNSARDGGTLAFNSRNQRGSSDVSVVNCILRNSDRAIWILDRSTVTI